MWARAPPPVACAGAPVPAEATIAQPSSTRAMVRATMPSWGMCHRATVHTLRRCARAPATSAACGSGTAYTKVLVVSTVSLRCVLPIHLAVGVTKFRDNCRHSVPVRQVRVAHMCVHARAVCANGARAVPSLPPPNLRPRDQRTCTYMPRMGGCARHAHRGPRTYYVPAAYSILNIELTN